MKVLVTGKGGQLASEFELLKRLDTNWHFLSEQDLNIADLDSVMDYFCFKKFDLIINCAGYTAVDKAEDEKELAYKVNAEGTKNLLQACELLNAKLIHYSTDYVFDGNSLEPYKEYDITKPKTIYGLSKLKGEQYILKKNKVKSLIIRTSWVYSNFGKNFVKTMIDIGQKNKRLGVVSDQIGSPTYAKNLAEDTLKVISNENYKWINGDLFHYSNIGSCSWFYFAKKIFEYTKNNVHLIPLKTEDYPTKALRPKYSLLDKTKFQHTFNIQIKSWEKSLKHMIKLELIK